MPRKCKEFGHADGRDLAGKGLEKIRKKVNLDIVKVLKSWWNPIVQYLYTGVDLILNCILSFFTIASFCATGYLLGNSNTIQYFFLLPIQIMKWYQVIYKGSYIYINAA